MFKTASGKKREKCSACNERQSDLTPMECSHQLCLSCLKGSLTANRNKRVVVCELCQHVHRNETQASILSEEILKERLARRSYRSTEKKKEQRSQVEPPTIVKERQPNSSKAASSVKEVHTSNLHMLESPSSDKEGQCNYHFNEKTHICVTCLRGVCVRCLQTLCEDHRVLNKQKGLQVIRNELAALYAAKVEDTELKFRQLSERKKFYQQRCQKVGEEIHSSFNHIRNVLAQKEQELLDYCIHVQKKVNRDYEHIYDGIRSRIDLLEGFKQLAVSDDSELERLRRQLKHINSLPQLQTDLTMSLQLDKVVDESRMERILFEIEELTHSGLASATKQRKYRTSTENAERSSLKVFRTIPHGKVAGPHLNL